MIPATRVVARRAASRLPVAATATRTLCGASYTSSSNNQSRSSSSSSTFWRASTLAAFAAVTLAAGVSVAASESQQALNERKATLRVDYDAVRHEIAELLDAEDYDDGSRGPLFMRLAWHSSGSYSKIHGDGGSNGAAIRFPPERDWGGNKGLQLAVQVLESVKQKHPGVSYGDLYTLAGVVAVEEMGGPKVPWRPGRIDHFDGKVTQPAHRRRCTLTMLDRALQFVSPPSRCPAHAPRSPSACVHRVLFLS